MYPHTPKLAAVRARGLNVRAAAGLASGRQGVLVIVVDGHLQSELGSDPTDQSVDRTISTTGDRAVAAIDEYLRHHGGATSRRGDLTGDQAHAGIVRKVVRGRTLPRSPRA